MASFSAELHVAGHVFPVTHCHFEVEQATQLRGRASAKVRYGPVQLVLDVPDGDVLPAWATDPDQRHTTAIVFLDANGGRAVETLHLPAAYCVAYQEQFRSGDAQGGSYQCFLTLSDPTGWTMAPGGPASAFVAPAAREHGPVAVGAVASSTLIAHTGGRGPNGMGDTVGVFSRRPYDPDSCGGPIASLDWKNAVVTKDGIALVIQHTNRFEKDPANVAMISRLQRISSNELTATDWDKRYYTHEIREYERYRQLGVPDGEDPGYEVWNDTHTATLEDYQLADNDAQGNSFLYHPDALL
ncbi:type VI secretion system tube protein TssD [Hymenobacter negativus]|uniref:type VI secretion system tube protein TssD n=1 Tax=Hymenobacter negativus TaxID=2795026 RepID=UPI00293D3B79|nr:type VI secretion system tube protein TssD [Hymenobacter negativus]